MPPVIPSLYSSLMSIHPSSKKLKSIRIFNILTFILFFFSSVYFKVLSYPNSGEISDKYPTYFTPHLTVVVSFWSILFFLQSGFAFYAQFNNTNLVQEVVKNIVYLWFSLGNLFMCGGLFFWMCESFIISEFFVLLALISTSIAQYKLVVKYMSNHILLPSFVILFVHVPFSMYSAFSWFALFYNGSIILSQYDYENVDLAILSALFLSVLGFLWSTTGIFSRRRRDLIFSLSIAWILLGIGVQQSVTRLSITCYVLALIQIMVILFIIYMSTSNSKTAVRSIDGGETENLLQHRMNYYGGIPPITRGEYNESDERLQRENLFQNRMNFYGGIIVDNLYRAQVNEWI